MHIGRYKYEKIEMYIWQNGLKKNFYYESRGK